MLVLKRLIAFVVTGVTVIAAGGVAWAGLGQPTPWELGLQQSASPVMDDIVWFHDFLLWLIAAIALFVLVLLAIVVVRFNARANPVPSRTTHNTAIEIIWTVVPVLILVTVAVPSFRLLFYQLKVPPADVTVKVTGKQWFWSYSYPDSKFEFDSLMVQDKDLKPGQLRLLVGRQRDGGAGQQGGAACWSPAPTSSTRSRCRRSASRSTPSPAASTRPGSRPNAKACITDNARSFAAAITPSCRSPCTW